MRERARDLERQERRVQQRLERERRVLPADPRRFVVGVEQRGLRRGDRDVPTVAEPCDDGLEGRAQLVAVERLGVRCGDVVVEDADDALAEPGDGRRRHARRAVVDPRGDRDAPVVETPQQLEQRDADRRESERVRAASASAVRVLRPRRARRSARTHHTTSATSTTIASTSPTANGTALVSGTNARFIAAKMPFAYWFSIHVRGSGTDVAAHASRTASASSASAPASREQVRRERADAREAGALVERDRGSVEIVDVQRERRLRGEQAACDRRRARAWRIPVRVARAASRRLAAAPFAAVRGPTLSWKRSSPSTIQTHHAPCAMLRRTALREGGTRRARDRSRARRGSSRRCCRRRSRPRRDARGARRRLRPARSGARASSA